jgi:predicted regulator of Ras-like GTPase activity (Roadblock/LC7/MglB family)
MDAAQALADLTEISSQIEGAVLAEADGKVVASTFPQEVRGEDVARAAAELVRAAEGSRPPGGTRLAQIQAATPSGSVFVVRDDARFIAAITASETTVGLVFYDLKTCLRLAAGDAAEQRAYRARTQETENGSSTPKEMTQEKKADA